jgi:hypothetical protein
MLLSGFLSIGYFLHEQSQKIPHYLIFKIKVILTLHIKAEIFPEKTIEQHKTKTSLFLDVSDIVKGLKFVFKV